MSVDSHLRQTRRRHGLAAVLLAVMVPGGCVSPAATIESDAPGSTGWAPPPPSSAAPGSGAPSVTPSADPDAPWEQVVWRQATNPFAEGPTALRVDRVVAWNSALMGHGRARTPGRNQFNEMAVVFVSDDGERWRTAVIDDGVGPGDTSEISLGARGAGGAVLFGNTCCEAEEAAIWRSADGLAWERQPLDAALFRDAGPAAIAAVDEGFVVVGSKAGQAAIWTSPDGRRWQEVDRTAAGLGRGGIGGLALVRGRWLAAGWQDDGTTYDGALWESADGTAWRRAPADPIHVGPLDTAFGGLLSTPAGVLLMGAEGPPEERVACEKLIGQTASLEPPEPPEPPRTAFSCGWGRYTHWWSRDGVGWQRLAPVAPGPGEPPLPAPRVIEFRVMTGGGPGIINLGEDGLGNVLLWLSDDGRSWRADTPISPFRKGADMVSGVAAVGRRIVAVGEVWDPQSGQPGAPAAWIGLAP